MVKTDVFFSGSYSYKMISPFLLNILVEELEGHLFFLIISIHYLFYILSSTQA